ncbi:energy-coupling factor transporter transmembrane component T family protein [Leadbettera azotonutricia]|uniref:Cobalt transport protein n=1 Tax=Leadbettera azotonutricia (strain ATCC BAA-888 / DSM 13862 / ZAS-9) TaxID=545695 RepID=F5Y6L0_LEAAZ|nr:energy-coupling factor transporter transmembrane component T [Leadbettera azotonutricia]AEF81970.1 cobalt transport protein [Leadbettera azotonutricia ZAS-9]
MTGLLDYVEGSSFLHRLNPLTKMLFAFVLCASCFITGNLYMVLGILVLNLIMSAVGGIIKRSLRVLLSLIKLSIVLFVVQIFFVREGDIIFRFPMNIYITDKGLLFSLLFVSRLIAATMPLTLMLSVTKMGDISNALNRYLKIPYKYTFALTTAIRFIPLFSDEMAGIIEAQISRGVDIDTKNFFKKIKLLLPLCVPLLISSVRKIEGGAISAELRGFNFRTPSSGFKHYTFALRDCGVFLFCILVAGAAIVV